VLLKLNAIPDIRARLDVIMVALYDGSEYFIHTLVIRLVLIMQIRPMVAGIIHIQNPAQNGYATVDI
jgi:hypothetical protein